MIRPARELGWFLCLVGALVLVWAMRGALSQWAGLFLEGFFSLFGWLNVLVPACLGLCVARLGLAMSRE